MAALIAACLASPATAYVRSTLSATDPTYLRWDLEETLMPLANVVGGEIVYVIDSAGSDNLPGLEDMQAVERAFQKWEGIGTSKVAFVRGADQSLQEADNDGVNMVYWAEGSTTRIGGTTQQVTGYVAMTPVFSVTAGANKGLILDANIILNGRHEDWTITPDSSPASYDVEGVLAHEIGHFIGLDHSSVLGAVMGPRFVAGEARHRTLEMDDIIGASEIYPDGVLGIGTGGISGLIGRPAGVWGALVGVTDSAGRVVVESMTGLNGAYLAPGLSDGNYEVYVAPIDPVPPSSTNLFDETDLGGFYGPALDPNFFATLPVPVTVAAPAVTPGISFLVGNTRPQINVAKIGGRATSAATLQWSTAPTFAVAGDTNIFIGVAGPNVGGPAGSVDIDITGGGITDTGMSSTGSTDGEPYEIRSYNIAANAVPGLRSIRVTSGALGRTYATGALKIYPNLPMSFAAPGLYFAPPGEVNNGRIMTQTPLTLSLRGDDIDLDWDEEPGAYGYHVYRGTLTSLVTGVYDHGVIPGTVNGQCGLTTSVTTLKGEALDPGSTYYLVTAFNNVGEGIIGRDSALQLRPPAAVPCTTQ